MEAVAFALTAAVAEKTVKKTTPAGCAVKFRKTEMCRYYPKCAKGEGCPYAHSECELRSRPNFTKTRMCAGYKDGRCRLSASDCPFAHGRHDLRPAGEAPAARPRGQRPPPVVTAKPGLTDVEPLKMRLTMPPPPGLADLADAVLTPTASGASTPTSFVRSGASTPPAQGPAVEAVALGPAEIGEELEVVARLRV